MRFFERFERHCQEKRITPHMAAQESGVATDLISQWKHNRRTPKPETAMKALKKIATYEPLETTFAQLAAWWAMEYIPPVASVAGCKAPIRGP